LKKKIIKFLNKYKFQNSLTSHNDFFRKISQETKKKSKKYSFGSQYPNKTFYIIKRSPGAGLFSNFLFVLKNIKYALKKKYIPIIDMENFPTKYHEKKNINNIKNIWELYFKQITKYKLSNVYKSKRVVFCKNNFQVKIEDYNDKSLRKIFLNYISINKKILKDVNKFYKKHFKKNLKIVGIHLRGTDQKVTPNHHLPPTLYDIIRIIEKKIKTENNIKFFIITEEKKYLSVLKNRYKKRIIYLNSFRADEIKDFNLSKRKFHRNKLGIESLKEAIIFSYCDEIYYCQSNIPLFSLLIKKRTKSKKILFNGINSKNQLIAFYKWYVTVLPISFLKYLLFKIRLI